MYGNECRTMVCRQSGHLASPTNEFIQIKSQELEATTISLNPQKKENDENLSP